jgi:NAD(P)-dependent dehydrogenase (short-subunit alcohol dehydrogenase family)
MTRSGGSHGRQVRFEFCHLTRYAVVELGKTGIRVKSLSPGPIATAIFGKGAGLAPDDAARQTDLAEAAIAAVLPRWQPLPIVRSVDDIAQAALFLASDASRLITSHNLAVDGGISAGWPASVTREDIRVFRTALQDGRPTAGA